MATNNCTALNSAINKLSPSKVSPQEAWLQLENTDTYQYNCWGFVAFIYGWALNPRWLDCQEIEHHLSVNTWISRFAFMIPGDVLVYREEDGKITHTAIYLGDEQLIHKPGTFPLELSTLEEVIADHGEHYCELAEVRRVISSR